MSTIEDYLNRKQNCPTAVRLRKYSYCSSASAVPDHASRPHPSNQRAWSRKLTQVELRHHLPVVLHLSMQKLSTDMTVSHRIKTSRLAEVLRSKCFQIPDLAWDPETTIAVCLDHDSPAPSTSRHPEDSKFLCKPGHLWRSDDCYVTVTKKIAWNPVVLSFGTMGHRKRPRQLGAAHSLAPQPHLLPNLPITIVFVELQGSRP